MDMDSPGNLAKANRREIPGRKVTGLSPERDTMAGLPKKVIQPFFIELLIKK